MKTVEAEQRFQAMMVLEEQKIGMRLAVNGVASTYMDLACLMLPGAADNETLEKALDDISDLESAVKNLIKLRGENG